MRGKKIKKLTCPDDVCFLIMNIVSIIDDKKCGPLGAFGGGVEGLQLNEQSWSNLQKDCKQIPKQIGLPSHLEFTEQLSLLVKGYMVMYNLSIWDITVKGFNNCLNGLKDENDKLDERFCKIVRKISSILKDEHSCLDINTITLSDCE